MTSSQLDTSGLGLGAADGFARLRTTVWLAVRKRRRFAARFAPETNPS